MRKSLTFLLALFAWAAACSDGSIPVTLIPPGPSDPGGPTQDGLGSETSSPATTSTPIGSGGQGTTTTVTTSTTACAPEGMPCSVPSDCCAGTCSAANVCISTCGNPGDTCSATALCCDPDAACEQSGPQTVCCILMGGSCQADSDCCASSPTCVIGACGN